MKTILLAFLLLVNLLAFALYGIDKLKAKKGAWRIPESTLLLVAFLGGSLGALLGMELFRHKTKHAKFKVLVPLFLILHIALGVYMFKSGLLACKKVEKPAKKALTGAGSVAIISTLKQRRPPLTCRSKRIRHGMMGLFRGGRICVRYFFRRC